MAKIKAEVIDLILTQANIDFTTTRDSCFAQMRCSDRGVVRYKNVSISRSGSAEIGMFIEEGMQIENIIFYGIDLPTSRMYIVSGNMCLSRIIKKPFKTNMTREELVLLLKRIYDLTRDGKEIEHNTELLGDPY